MSGKSQSKSGRIIREVFSPANAPVEAKKIKAIQASSGP
jgi:hypothetical protein